MQRESPLISSNGNNYPYEIIPQLYELFDCRITKYNSYRSVLHLFYMSYTDSLGAEEDRLHEVA